MKIVFHEAFYPVYASDPAAAAGRMEAVMKALAPAAEVLEPDPADERQIAAVHTPGHIGWVRHEGVYEVAALAAGGAILAAETGLIEPCFAAIRPPGHHASSDSAWGFCYFNNMAVALTHLHRDKKIASAFVLDIDLHYGDGTEEILGDKKWVEVYNVPMASRNAIMSRIGLETASCCADIIGVSAGFDNHENDWGRTLKTEDYREIGRMVRMAADTCGGGCFALLEGGYNHHVLGGNALALMEGMAGG